MAAPADDRRNFFISFNSADRSWAEWIAAELEKAGYTTYFQHWDFRPGSNFILEMNKAALADRTIAVLSPQYLNALFTQPEWAEALRRDPTGQQRKLIPVRVADCQPDGLLGSRVYADLVGLGEEEARGRLLAAASDVRPKPDSVPYPAGDSQPFPGNSSSPNREISPAETTPPGDSPSHGSLLMHAALSAVCFLLGAGLLAVMIWKVETLDRFGLTGKLYYLVLVPIGLAAGGFLFGVLRSLAIYRGAPLGGSIELRGPIVAAALVVIGGFVLPPPEAGSFSMTVFVHGQQGGKTRYCAGTGKSSLTYRVIAGSSPSTKRARRTFWAFPGHFAARTSRWRSRRKDLKRRGKVPWSYMTARCICRCEKPRAHSTAELWTYGVASRSKTP